MKINNKIGAALLLACSTLVVGCTQSLSLVESESIVSSRSISENNSSKVTVTAMKDKSMTITLQSKKVNYARLYVSMGNGTGLVLANQDMTYSDDQYTFTLSHPTFEEGAEIYYTILVNDGSEYCLPQGSLADTTSWATITYGAEQIPETKKVYSIISKNSGLALDNQDWSKEEDSNIQQWAFTEGNTNQLWMLEADGTGYYTIINAYSDLCLSVKDSSLNDGGNVVQSTINGSDNQKWGTAPLDDGTFALVNKNSGLVLDVAWASKDNGANIQQCRWNSGDAQRWYIKEVIKTAESNTPSQPELPPVDTNPSESDNNESTSNAPSYSKYLNNETIVERTTGLMTMQFKNTTNGKWSDDQIYITAIALDSESRWCYLTPNGSLEPISADSSSENWSYTLAQLKGGVQMPAMTSGRMYVSMGSPVYLKGVVAADGRIGIAQPDLNNPNDPNHDKYFDWIEFTLSNVGFWGNTTQVDQFSFPIVMAMYNTDGYYRSVGVTETRDEIFSAFEAMGGEFATLVEQPYRIVAPCKGQFRTGRAFGNYMDSYVNECWNNLLDKKQVLNISHPLGNFVGYTTADGKLVFNCTASGYGAIAQVGKNYYVNGKPNNDELFEGSGVLATPSEGADGNQTTVELALQAWVCAALNRHVFMDTANWSNPDAWYKEGEANYYAAFWHKHNIDNAAYGFCYDDVADQSSLIQTGNPRGLVIGIGW